MKSKVMTSRPSALRLPQLSQNLNPNTSQQQLLQSKQQPPPPLTTTTSSSQHKKFLSSVNFDVPPSSSQQSLSQPNLSTPLNTSKASRKLMNTSAHQYRMRTENEIGLGDDHSAMLAGSTHHTFDLPTQHQYLSTFDTDITGAGGSLRSTPATTTGNKVIQSTFKRTGARFSLNETVNHSPAKIFIRQNKLNGGENHHHHPPPHRQGGSFSMTNLASKSQEQFTRFLSNRKLARTEEDDNQDEADLPQDINLLKNLQDTSVDDIQLEDKTQKDLVGDSAVLNYYGHYKKLSKILQQNSFFSVPPSLHTEVLVETEKRNVIPSKLGLIKHGGDEDLLQLSHMQFGDQYASILSSGLQKQRAIKKYQLQDNRISERSSAQLLSIISKHANELNLASNHIGKLGCENLSWSLRDQKCMIEFLNLEDNKLGDHAILTLLKGISNNKSLNVVNLSKNFLSDKVCDELQTILLENELKELYLHWNMITGPGGAKIFEGLKTNDSLRVLDLSYNMLGKSVTKEACTPQICEYIKINQELIHLDLSNNSFGFADSTAIAAALEKNKTIYGFHFAGNYGYVDSRGFLVVEDAQQEDLTAMHTKMRIDGCKMVENSIFRMSRDKDLRDCCWICEGWKEMKFTWNSGVSGELANDPMFIHFNFEDFRGNFFGKGNGIKQGFSEVFTYSRMIPPGELKYFFSGEDSSETANDQEKKFNYEGSTIPNVEIYSGQIIEVPLKETNFANIHAMKDNFYKYIPRFQIKPRTRDEEYVPPKQKKFKFKWTFPISLFAKWRRDDDELMQKCFDFDWDYGKIPRLIKKEEELVAVKSFFRARYQVIKDCYKNYATKSPIGDVWAISNPAFLELVERMKVVDRNLIKDPDINLKWVSTISSIPQADKTNPRNPIQAISRYQMMEVLVRIAEEKYILKLKSTTNYFEAVQMFWNDHLAQEMNSQYDLQTWRKERYWNEECDTCLKHYKRIVEHVYKRYSKMKVKPGQLPFMCLEELQAICTKAGLLEEAHFGPNVALQAFNFSMMTQIDELQQDRTFQMSMVEFYEALARIAEAASLEPISGLYFIDEEWNLERRKNQPLGHKLEALLVRLLNTLSEAVFKEKYPPINRSFFVKEEEDEDVEMRSP